MAEQDPNIQGDGVNNPAPYVTAEVAWEMSKRAAAEARAEAIKDAQVQMQNSGNTRNNRDIQDNRYVQDNRDTQNNRYPQDNRDYRRDRDDDYEDRSRRRRRRDEDDEEEDLVGFSPKLIKQLQTTVGVFNTLKDFSSNPMQKAIEDRIGGLAAGIIENAFSVPRGPPPKRDIVDTILNSQMAFGLGQGLGSRAPELVETLSKSFGKEKAENMIDGMIGKYGGGERRRIESGDKDKAEASEPSRPSPTPQKSDDQSNIELLLSLDPNNPEHVAAYAESQGGISIDVARKMLMIHQDDIIKRMKSQGADTTIIESQRGSRIGQDNPSQRSTTDQDITQISEPKHGSPIHRVDVASDYHTPPVQQVPHVPQPPPAQRTAPVVQAPHIQQSQESDIQEDMQYVESGLENTSEDYQKQDKEYVEYKDVGKDKPLEKNVEKDSDQVLSNNQQTEMMKAFADDIEKVMGNVIGKIEGLNNTVFSLQSELNEIKKQKAQPSSTQSLDQRPLGQQIPIHDSFPERIQEPMRIQDSFPEGIQEHVSIQDSFPERLQEPFQEEIQESMNIQDSFQEETQKPKFARDFFPGDSEREPEESRFVQNAPPGISQSVEKPKSKIYDMENFFPEKVQNMRDFERELEEDTKRAVQSMKKASADKMPEAEVESKEIEIIKKPIVSMVNKKRVSYLPKQKGNNIQSENKDKKTKKENENNENSGNNDNGGIDKNSENSNSNNGDIDKNNKDNTHDDIDKDKAK